MIGEMTINELITKMESMKNNGRYEFVFSISPSGVALRRHEKSSSQNDVRPMRFKNPDSTKRWRVSRMASMEDVEKIFAKAEIQAKIDELRIQLKELGDV